jgi:ABC-type Zn uptake system ZnuABC Zn-binding protein ZnuA
VRASIQQEKQGRQKMTAAVLRKELHTMIDTIPDRSLPAIKPLLTYIADDYWKPVIEPVSPKDIKMINERLKDYEVDPSSFVSFKRRKKG